MEVTSLSSCKLSWRAKYMASPPPCRRRSCSGVAVRARERDHELGKVVDESMIVLRLRIREIKMLEMNQQEPPSNWMEWEKKYYAHYDEDVFEAVGLLQSYLMSVRPSFALGMVALVALSVSISSGIVLIHALGKVKILFSSLGSS